MLVNQFLDDLAVEQVAWLCKGEIVKCIVVKDVFAIGRENDLVKVCMRCAIQNLCHIVDNFLVKSGNAFL